MKYVEFEDEVLEFPADMSYEEIAQILEEMPLKQPESTQGETDYQVAKRGTKTNLLTKAAETTEDLLSGVVSGLKKPAAGITDLLSDVGVPVDKFDAYLDEYVPFLGQASRFISGKQATAEQRSPTAAATGEFVGEMAALAAPSTALSKVGTGLPLAARALNQGISQGALAGATTETQEDTPLDGRGTSLVLGGLLGTGGELVGDAVTTVAKRFNKVPTEEAVQRAKGLQLLEETGVTIPTERGQLLTGETSLGDSLVDLPLSGQKQFREDTLKNLKSAIDAKVAADTVEGSDDLILGAVKSAQEGQKAKLSQTYKDVVQGANEAADKAAEDMTSEAILQHDLWGNYVDPNAVRQAAREEIIGTPEVTNAAIRNIDTGIADAGVLADPILVKDVDLISQAVNDAKDFNQLKAARERVNQMSSEAFRSGRYSEPYKQMKAAIDEDMAAYVERIGDPSLAQKYRDTNKTYKEFKEFWDAGSVKGLTRKEEGYDLYQSLVTGDSTTRNKRFAEIISKLPEAKQTEAKKAVVSKYLNSAIEAGSAKGDFSVKAFTNYMQKNKHILDYADAGTKENYENIIKFLKTTQGMEKQSGGISGLTLKSAGLPLGVGAVGWLANPVVGAVLTAGTARGTGAFVRRGDKAAKLLEKFNNASSVKEREAVLEEIVQYGNYLSRPAALTMVNEEDVQ